jgi:hypothetical protein
MKRYSFGLICCTRSMDRRESRTPPKSSPSGLLVPHPASHGWTLEYRGGSATSLQAHRRLAVPGGTDKSDRPAARGATLLHTELRWGPTLLLVGRCPYTAREHRRSTRMASRLASLLSPLAATAALVVAAAPLAIAQTGTTPTQPAQKTPAKPGAQAGPDASTPSAASGPTTSPPAEKKPAKPGAQAGPKASGASH